MGYKHSVRVEYAVREEVTEVNNVRLSHTRESVHPDKCGCIVCIQEEYTSIKIGQDWNAFAVEVSEGHYREESIDNESYELINVDMEDMLVLMLYVHTDTQNPQL